MNNRDEVSRSSASACRLIPLVTYRGTGLVRQEKQKAKNAHNECGRANGLTNSEQAVVIRSSLLISHRGRSGPRRRIGPDYSCVRVSVTEQKGCPAQSGKSGKSCQSLPILANPALPYSVIKLQKGGVPISACCGCLFLFLLCVPHGLPVTVPGPGSCLLTSFLLQLKSCARCVLVHHNRSHASCTDRPHSILVTWPLVVSVKAVGDGENGQMPRAGRTVELLCRFGATSGMFTGTVLYMTQITARGQKKPSSPFKQPSGQPDP